MTLKNCKSGDTVSVETVSLPENEKRRLEILGMTRGTKIAVLQMRPNGAAVVCIRGARYAFGNRICAGIFVGPCAEKAESEVARDA